MAMWVIDRYQGHGLGQCQWRDGVLISSSNIFICNLCQHHFSQRHGRLANTDNLKFNLNATITIPLVYLNILGFVELVNNVLLLLGVLCMRKRFECTRTLTETLNHNLDFDRRQG